MPVFNFVLSDYRIGLPKGRVCVDIAGPLDNYLGICVDSRYICFFSNSVYTESETKRVSLLELN